MNFRTSAASSQAVILQDPVTVQKLARRRFRIMGTAIFMATVLLALATWLVFINQFELPAWIGLFATLAGIVFNIRQWRVTAARRRARRGLEKLRREVGFATRGDGADYAWIKYTPERPAFILFLEEMTRRVRELEVSAQKLERDMAARRFWQTVSAMVEAWHDIAGATISPIEHLQDSQWWTSGGCRIQLNAQPRSARPGLRLVVDNTKRKS